MTTEELKKIVARHEMQCLELSVLKEPESTLKSTLNPTDAKIVELIRGDGSVTIPVLEGKLGLSREGVRKALKRLKKSNVIRRVGPDNGGHWELVS